MRLSPAGTARNRQGECDRRSPSPSGRITLDTRVIIANFSARYAEMITRVSLAMYRTVRRCSLTVGDRADRHHAHWQRGLSSSLSRRDYAITPGGHVPRSWLRPARRRPAAGGRAGDADRVPARPAADAAAEVRRAGCRAAGPPGRGTVHDVPAGPGPAPGRGGTRLVPPPVRRARRTQAVPDRGRSRRRLQRGGR